MAHTKPHDITLAHKALVALTAIVALMALVALTTRFSTLPVGVRDALAEDVTGLTYEVKLCLDPTLALDDDLEPVQALRDALAIDGTYKENSNLYLETAARDYQLQGWVNRVRLKQGKKTKVELVYKRRYKVEGDDLDAAVARAASEGFDVANTTDAYTSELDWGYRSMTLSFTNKASLPYEGVTDLSELPQDEIRKIARDNMVDEEANWVSEGWGRSLVDEALFAGPLRYRKYTGAWNDTEVALEVWPIPDASSQGTSYICEVSFEGDDRDKTAAMRTELIAMLDDLHVLVHEDSLKTGTVLNAYLGQPTDEVPDDVPAEDDTKEDDDPSETPKQPDDSDGKADDKADDKATNDKGADDKGAGGSIDRDASVHVMSGPGPFAGPHAIGPGAPMPAGTYLARPGVIAGTGPSYGHAPAGEAGRTDAAATTAPKTTEPTTTNATNTTNTVTTTTNDAAVAAPEAIAAVPAPATTPTIAQVPLDPSPAATTSSEVRLPLAATSDATDTTSAGQACLALACLTLACASLSSRREREHAA